MVLSTDDILVAGSLVSFLLFIMAVNRYFLPGKISIVNQEKYLRDTLEGKVLKKGKYQFRVEHIDLEENNGVLYRLKRMFKKYPNGTSYITLGFMDLAICKTSFENEIFDVFFESIDISSKMIETEIMDNRTVILFEINGVRRNEIKMFIQYLLEYFYYLEKEGLAEIELTAGNPSVLRNIKDNRF